MQRVRRLREPTRQVAERPAEATDQHEQEGQDGGGLERAAVRLVVAALSEIGANLGRART